MLRWLLPLAACTACSEQPERDVTAEVIALRRSDSKWRPGDIVVTARTDQGLIGTSRVQVGRLNCRLGDRVKARARGVYLRLDDRVCGRSPF